MLSTAHFENAAPILAELELQEIFEVLDKLKDEKDSHAQLAAFFRAFAGSGKLHSLRRLAAILEADVEELLEAEGSEAKMAELLAEAAKKPFYEALGRVFGFFLGLAPSASAILASFGSPTNPPTTSEAGSEGSRSADS